MSGENPLGKALGLLWDGLPESDRGPRPKLMLRQVVDAGIRLADAEGIEALSMRKLAQSLEVGTMSLYRYVSSKSELLHLMLDAVAGPTEPRTSAVDAGWREFLAVTAREARQLYLTHPWTLQANWSRPVLGPNSIADLELFMSGVGSLRLSDQEKMNLATALDSYVMGAVRQELLWNTASSDSGLSDEEFWAHHHPTVTRAMESGRFPVIAQLSEDSFDSTWQESFEFGIEVLLDGVAMRLARAHTRASAE